jgi:lincosamide nucleotidyltransferase A/C/D/E
MSDCNTRAVGPEAQLAALDSTQRLLDEHGIEHWLFGGWAVDFHAGRVSRAHDDLDLAVWMEDLARIDRLLAGSGWTPAPEEGEDGYTGYERAGVRLELAFLARDEDGTVYTPLENGRGAWPEAAFGDEIAWLGGVRARVIGLGALRADKSSAHGNPRAAAKDRADLETLDAPRQE